MMLLFLVSGGLTVFLLVAALILMFSGKETVDERLMEIAVSHAANAPGLSDTPNSALGQVAATLTGPFKPVRDMISGPDGDLEYRLTQAGFRKAEHVQIYTAVKMLLPVMGIVGGSFLGSNMIMGIVVGVMGGYFAPDLVLMRLTSRRQETIRLALPNALDLLVICMEAGLGIDQAMMRVSEEMKLTAPVLAEELQIINREQRAGKPRLDAWRSMAERVNVEYVSQFVSMLVQTEKYGTPIAQALGAFADHLRERRTQAAEEMAAKTGVKLLFPLVLFIFPSIFVVTLGPAILGIKKILEGVNN
jgi:tight adherence protein C